MKCICCYHRAKEDAVRREAAAMEAVASLDGCLQVIDKYAVLSNPIIGGIGYSFVMPCALRLLCRPGLYESADWR